IAQDTTREIGEFIAALGKVPGQLLCCYPNADAGSRDMVARLAPLCSKFFVNLEPVVYWSLLQYVDLLLGNSSSGIIEAASMELPAVNVGLRQRGREHGRNVLDAEPQREAILECVATARSEE